VSDVLGLLGLLVYIAFMLALSMGVTWTVIKISPSESAKEERRAKKAAASSGT
jgi:hypothetical protein